MPKIQLLIQRILELMKRYPGVIALGGFISGVGSFIMVDRQQGLASWITVIMLLSWIWLMLENTLTGLFTRVFKREIPQPLLRYATQMIHQESLFFVLPFFFITTTWNSGQLFFTGLLSVAALISIVDPLYYKWLAPRRWAFLALHTLTLFAAGAIVGWRRGYRVGLPLLLIAYIPATLAPVLTNMRYTVTVQPLMFIFMAIAIDALARWLRRGAAPLSVRHSAAG